MKGDDLVFQGATRVGTNNNITGLTLNGVTFAQGAAAFTLNGVSWTSIGNITNNSSKYQSIGAAVSVAANQTWDGGSAGLRVTGSSAYDGYSLVLKNTMMVTPALNLGVTKATSIKLTDGSQLVFSGSSVLGVESTGAGTVIADGVGTGVKFTSFVNVGARGTGSISVLNGALFNSSGLTVGGVGSNVLIKGAGSLWKANGATPLNVANGVVSIEDGGRVESGAIEIGASSAGGVAVVRVSGVGSTWTTGTGGVVLGGYGKGTLQIENGASVTSTNATLGYKSVARPEATADATVTGFGSRWTNQGSMSIGSVLKTALSVLDSGVVTTNTAEIGAKGQVNLDGGTLEVGSASITAGGVFNWVKGVLGITGTGGTTVGTGLLGSTTTLATGQTLNVSNTLTVGSGKAVVLNGGELNAKATTLSGGTIRSTGDIDVARTGNITGTGVVDGAIKGGAANTITASGGNLTLGNVATNNAYAFAGTLNVGANKAELLSANQAQLGVVTSLAANGQLSTVNGANLAAGNVLNFSGNSTISGNFTNNGQVVGTTGTLSFANDVNGAGSYAGNVQFQAAFNPGNSPATVNFNGGNATFATGSVLNMEILGSTAGVQYDQLVNINTLTFNGTLNLIFSNGYVPLAGSSFALLGFNTLNGSLAADHITVTGYDRSRLDFSHLATNGVVSVTAVPEPETYAMFLAGLGMLGVVARRRRTAAA